ncbi:Aste57867_13142 [Aphanomyces stellatus]|uniref:Aste57867_13142 protein n=1 Tax=Aphanomyces stellatus TaxID=120398 RepID=A0A485KXD1_9STRA|nr:hypothetical protein As57867_013093 [Aphanomyces stellatus]VFT89984.1 Aste57867_13142 [Aphanomyces stellatus]
MRAPMLAMTLSAATVTAMELQLHRQEAPFSIKRNLHTAERMRRLDDGRYEVVPLNLGMGTHYTWVYAGTPPQRTSVIVDTGSHEMAFPCKGCNGCGKHTDTPFDALASSTLLYPTCSDMAADKVVKCAACEEDTCVVSQMYSEGSSWKAVMVEDNVWLGDAAVDATANSSFGTRFRFGCQREETGLFTTQVANGIMGVSNKAHNVVKKLFVEDKIDHNVFSLCFTPTGGAMSIGTALTARHKENATYAQVTFDETGWYAVEVRGIRIAGAPIQVESLDRLMNGPRKVIVDSGTTDSYLPDALAGAFHAAFNEAIGKDYEPNGDGYSKTEKRKMPTIEFVLAGTDGDDVIMAIPPSRYLKKKENGRYYPTILLDETAGGVIGADLMMNHDVIFDPDRNRVGFAKADCDVEARPSEDGEESLDDGAPESHVVVDNLEAAVQNASIVTKKEDDEEYPLVLTLGGISIGVLFVVGMAVAICKSKDPRWTQVNLDELDHEEVVELVENVDASEAAHESLSYDTPPDADDEFFNAHHEEEIVDKAALHQMDVQV